MMRKIFVVCLALLSCTSRFYETHGRPTLGVDYTNGWFLLHHLLGINLPYEPSSDVVVSYNQPFDKPLSTALFWTQWSEWPTCPIAEPCYVDKAHKSPIHMLKRTRLCHRQALTDLVQTNSAPTQLTWLQASQNHSPCLVEHARETQVKFCHPTRTCPEEQQRSEKSVFDETTEPSFNTSLDENQSQAEIGQNKTRLPSMPENIMTQPNEDDDEEDLWNPWHLFVSCRPLIMELDEFSEGFAWDYLLLDSNLPKGKRCEPGIEIYRRDCKPYARVDGACGLKNENDQKNSSYQLHQAHCWINEQCPGGNQSTQGPLACDFRTFSSEPRLRVTWHRTPYGRTPAYYQIALVPIDMILHNPLSASQTKNISIRSMDPWGEAYSTELEDLQVGQAYKVSVSAVDENHRLHTSDDCQIVSIIGAGDGSWSSWSTWSSCSSRCASVPGIRTRTRLCDSPAPSINGRRCSGSDQMQLSCFGENLHC